jgi:hypothetical protein
VSEELISELEFEEPEQFGTSGTMISQATDELELETNSLDNTLELKMFAELLDTLSIEELDVVTDSELVDELVISLEIELLAVDEESVLELAVEETEGSTELELMTSELKIELELISLED